MLEQKYEVDFHFGKRYISPFKVYLTAAIIHFVADLINRFLKVDHYTTWAVVDDYGKKFHVPIITSIILQAPQLLERRIEAEVDKALAEYAKEIPKTPSIPEPIWIDEADGETPLGGELGFTYDFVIDLEEKTDEQR